MGTPRQQNTHTHIDNLLPPFSYNKSIKMMTVTMKPTLKPAVQMKTARATKAQPKMAMKFEEMGKVALAGVASFALAASANAATIKLGSDSGELVFVPNSITVKAGETITFENNRGFPHNVVFDEDDLNGPGEQVTNTFDTPGEYSYYCEPHQGAG